MHDYIDCRHGYSTGSPGQSQGADLNSMLITDYAQECVHFQT